MFSFSFDRGVDNALLEEGIGIVALAIHPDYHEHDVRVWVEPLEE